MIMKKNLFKSLLTMCALGAMFTACSNEGNEVPDVTKGEKKTVFMKLDLKPQTKATENALGAVTAPVNDLHIYFYDDATKNIQKYVKITSSTTPSINDLATGKQIEDVPAVADKVLVRGNVPASASLPTSGLITVVENKEIEITTQSNKDQILLGHIATNIQTWGGSGSAPISGMQSGDKYAEIQLEPAVARIEIEGMQAQGTVITGFKLDGIYLTNFYEKLKLGDGTSSSQIQYGADASKYDENAGGTLYTTANKGKLFDKFTAPLQASGTPLEVSPTSGGNRWAYHVFDNAATTANSQLQIVFKLSDLQASVGSGITFPASTPQFITVRGFKDNGGNIVTLEKGKIYTISKADFKFDESNLTTVPNTNAVGVWLKVT
ncbi:hypothetical protein HMPREF1981_00244, partial [Bacteroides pyogenes F0041]